MSERYNDAAGSTRDRIERLDNILLLEFVDDLRRGPTQGEMTAKAKLRWLARLERMEHTLTTNLAAEYDEARRQFREYEPMLARLRKQLRPVSTPADEQANGAP